MRNTLLLLLMLLAPSVSVRAQSHPFLERFQATEVGGMVFLSWTLRAGNTCNGVQIQRAVGSSSFTPIGEIPGVCGSIDQNTDYTFFDSIPAPQALNRYRLELGNEGLSQIISIQLSGLGTDAYQIRPHPVTDVSVLKFKNEKRKTHTLKIYGIDGKTFSESSTDLDNFTLYRHEFASGTYLFVVLDAEGRVSFTGKIMVAP